MQDAYDRFYANNPNATLGAPNGAVWVMRDTGVEEFVIEGGGRMPEGSFSFRMDDHGNIEVLKRW